MERLLQHQRKQNTTVFLLVHWRGAGGGGGDSGKVWVEKSVSECSEVTLSLKGCAIPEGGIWAHQHYFFDLIFAMLAARDGGASKNLRST